MKAIVSSVILLAIVAGIAECSMAQVIPDATRASEDGRAISLDRALTCASSLRIPLWDAPEDDAGVLAGLRCKFAVRPSVITSLS